jgi:hypothetical protein
VGARFAAGLLSYVLLAVLFSPARRANGFATFHDLLTDTRVVVRGAGTAPHLVDMDVSGLATPVSDVHVLGPYRVLEELRTPGSGRVFVASDEALQRRVWIHSAAGTPALSVTRRELARPCRLRWLAGARRDREAWDAFEAPAGAPLRVISATPQPWRVVKHWLYGLVRELELGIADGTLKSLSVDRVWITRRGAPILLEWEVAQTPAVVFAADRAGGQQFLWHVAAGALNGAPVNDCAPIARPLPLDARSTLQRLEDSAFDSLAALRAAFEPLMLRGDVVSARRRAASMLLPGMLFLGIAMVSLIVGLFTVLAGSADLPHWLDERAALETRLPANHPRREAIDVYLAAIYATDLRGAAFWNSPGGRARRAWRPSIRRMLERRPTASSSELSWATDVLRPDLERRARGGWSAVNPADLTWMFVVQAVAAAVLAGITAFATRGGVGLRWGSIGVTSGSGRPVSGSRALVRAVVAWSPVFASGALILGLGLPPRPALLITAASMLVMAAGALYAVLKPERGIQDLLVGTWLVPR